MKINGLKSFITSGLVVVAFSALAGGFSKINIEVDGIEYICNVNGNNEVISCRVANPGPMHVPGKGRCEVNPKSCRKSL